MERVPQYIDVEDKIAGPFTWKQLAWYFGAGAILTVLWNVLTPVAFWIAAIPIGLVTTALAFYRPNGVPFIKFIGFAFMYVMHPKTYVWQRDDTITQTSHKAQKTKKFDADKEKLSLDDITEAARTLDSHGAQRSDRINAIMKANAKKRK